MGYQMMNKLEVETLAITLGEQTIGYLTHYHDGKNVFIFDQTYIELAENRPTLSLSFIDRENESLTRQRLNKTYCTMHALPTYFSNMLPEGSLRDYILATKKIHPNDEFSILKALSDDLPGNIRIHAIQPLTEQQLKSDFQPEVIPLAADEDETLRFSLAGIQMKLSMKRRDARFTLSRPGNWGDYIIKTPSSIHAHLPENEYSMMRLAQAAGVSIPEISLVDIDKLDHLPPINLPQEKYAFAIKRFDREIENRIHIEDFAQVLGLRGRDKYGATNYDTLARILLTQSQRSIQDLEQFITRITVNILLGNTDAHIKNWSLIYHDKINPILSPAYDIVSSLTYINDRNNALNLGGIKYFYDLSQDAVDKFIRHILLPADIVNHTIKTTVEAAQATWPQLIKELPIKTNLKNTLNHHFTLLQHPFKINPF
jgi:serine/threonine-protein kinase HipA